MKIETRGAVTVSCTEDRLDALLVPDLKNTVARIAGAVARESSLI